MRASSFVAGALIGAVVGSALTALQLAPWVAQAKPDASVIDVGNLVVLSSVAAPAHATLAPEVEGQPPQQVDSAGQAAGLAAALEELAAAAERGAAPSEVEAATPAPAPAPVDAAAASDEPVLVVEEPIELERVVGMRVEVTGKVRATTSVPSVSGLALEKQDALRRTWVRVRGRVRRLPLSGGFGVSVAAGGGGEPLYALDELEVLEVHGDAEQLPRALQRPAK